jgi:hypothetical protein
MSKLLPFDIQSLEDEVSSISIEVPQYRPPKTKRVEDSLVPRALLEPQRPNTSLSTAHRNRRLLGLHRPSRRVT